MISVDFQSAPKSQGKLHFPCAGSASYSFVDLLPESLLESVFHLASQGCIIEPATNRDCATNKQLLR